VIFRLNSVPVLVWLKARLCLVGCVLIVSCANDVILGEHITAVTISPAPAQPSGTATQSSDMSSGKVPGFDDDDSLHGGGKGNDWRRDGGLPFDGGWPDGGRRSSPPDHLVGEPDPDGPYPDVSPEPRPTIDVPPSGAQTSFDRRTASPPATDTPLSP
jgi:hypothetical protein